ncbi:MAG: 3-hydroxyacyl-CoA dehydrogenase family protein [Proteobacteria bacterium]|nr:3-hydroxyacyl-CoA dehydrogenase family protein [Pseudomonadota bacterium]MBU1449559.1 3-hydroxyacyl-CoA dehydrogenase family protein [Pseudomonadota bacterium]MBU2467412.1 3-hydroxyacyl-CoA dehydrogenase family protein [Pseudomonadota bacterium]MBU2516856.1 3-hydroxyacyl-CoA dehydrogenase family protein [Pseudomonadota bacterium]
MNIKKVMVVGCGTMGAGIVQVCAQSGLQVVMTDLSQEMLDKALKSIAWSVGKLADKGKLTDDKDTVMARITASEDYAPGADADLVIEAVFESLDVKKEVFARLENTVGPDTLLASNTSAIPISAIGGATQRPQRVLGLHFFNPVPMMDAVEVIKGISTSEETMEAGMEFIRFIGKHPIRVDSDIAGFILNRCNMLTNMEAYRLVEQKVATPEDIDTGFRLAFGRKMGPLETSDLVGLDVQLMAYTNVYEEEKDQRFYPPSILRRKVEAGQLGRKTGKGWYDYDKDGKRIG